MIKKIAKNRQENKNNKRKTVFVGLSGGVDSSVSAVLLLEQGYEVVGVFIRTWHPDFLECNEEEERRDAMRVAAHLHIPFLTFDLADVYKKEVADYMISEYKKGRTPNPDVMCNREVKFGAFLKKALSMGADFVATGHYARISPLLDKEGVGGGNSKNHHPAYGTPPQKGGEGFKLLKAPDPSKDQSYFLWTLNQERLSKILFPVGHLKKTEVRKLAKKFKLPVAEKKDSQGICFLGDIDLKEFLKHYIKEKKGKVLNTEGIEIGYHDGAVFHTLGERHGFTITEKTTHDKRYYVVSKDLDKNILVVSENPSLRPPLTGEGWGEVIQLEQVNWINEIPEQNKKYTAQIRYHGEFLSCRIKPQSKALGKVIFEKPILVASGQSVVIYDNDIVLGGGVVV
ncbi:MAG: tRNA (5-methylaminomethyl-2-thiouridylate)-methyltransferase [Candidatus Nomurabacteria bacterium GW2011_GWA2_40_9]|uniref:tRNA-specific 2-thiouridylase MnmA n=1 Tax=Candidatus Nomurabacteria bacterium GW2011_GWA2_40_9 TaxID=1618734 RepID=A0A0G0W357_9BACT|nr:MAG: tRNA (5-methylaminomethyl-2-thiouridylate)-methyltransferase [Candidatus Nomurabacteria bacterium GW2011_GWA2_40_9]